MIGKILGHYQITSLLGKGGMGEVYQAKDLKLGRDVAIKILPEEFAQDADRVARFQREAKLLAALNHPNVAAIYGLEESERTNFLVLELVEGETLAEMIAGSTIGSAELPGILKIALQIVEALEAAHEKDIVHRDLKPANIKITPEGLVKVLDFGLAKAFAGEQSSVNLSNSPTMSNAATQQGVILGTAAYMSPEQARGAAVDRRTDIWAFGAVLFEMLTGHACFGGETLTDVLASVMRADPDWTLLPASVSSRLRRLLQRCLVKDRKQRLQSIGDARIELGEIIAAPAEVPDQPSTNRRPILWLTAAALVAGLILGGFLLNWMRPSPSISPDIARPMVHTTIELPKEAPLALGSHIPSVGYNSPVISLSPDGSYLAYVGISGSDTIIFLRQMATGDIRPIAGTEGAIYSFFSPSEKWLGFLTNDKVKKVDLRGGAPITLCEADTPVLAWWTREDLIYFTEGETSAISHVSAEGGNAARILNATGMNAGFCDVLPGGKWVLENRKYGAGGDSADIFAINPETKEAKQLIRSGYGARYVAPGYLLFARAGCLMVVSFDADRGEVSGEPITIAMKVDMDSLFSQVQASATINALLAYVPGGDLSIGRLAFVDRQGKTEYLDAPAQVYGVVELSPDGKRLAVQVADVQDYVWIYAMERKEGRRLQSSDPAGWPLWRPDGRAIAMTTWNSGKYTVVLRNPDEGMNTNSGQAVAGINTESGSWSPSGRLLAAQDFESDRIRFISFESHVDSLQIDGFFPSFSPDEKWIAYNYSQSGQRQIYIRSYPDGKINRQLSINGGIEPRWKPSGELFFRNGNRWFSTHVSTTPELHWGPPRLAFETDFIDTPGMSYDITPDGQRLLVVRRAQAINPTRIEILMNWTEAVKQQAKVK
jgi:eukaryotic-like serine/threonine-protein kinase